MFLVSRVEDTVRIPPNMFGRDLVEVAEIQLREKYENTYDDRMGYVILINKVEVNPLGKILSEDGASYHKAKFDVYSFKPVINEIVEGEIVEIANFGVFVRVGPLDALLHISQIIDDYVSVDTSQGTVIGRETNKILRVGDLVRARTVAVSPPRGASVGKIGLTGRQPFLGKMEWIEEELERVRAREHEETKAHEGV
ncbi:MAG: DNA-directed RNA polymerase [Candidatus Geothermarchaeales archaeon]